MSEQKKQNILFRLFKLVIWIAIIGWILFYNQYWDFSEKPIILKKEKITVKSWETFRWLSQKFTDNSINKYYLRTYLYFNTPKKSLQAGEYTIAKNATIEDILTEVTTSIKSIEVKVTFLEGWNIFDIDEYLTHKELIKEWEFINYARTSVGSLKWQYPFLENALTLEWFLYPDSYRLFKDKFSPEYLAKKMLDNFETKVYEKILEDKSGKEIMEIVNLASILEKEEKSNKEKPTVAGILKKRYKANWMIWADITVCYPHDLTAEECKMVVSKYIKEKNEYNTRTKVWLPKTPIGNPQFSSIDAVVHSKDSPYWFYLHNTNSWEIYYWKDNAEHESNKKYLYR